MFQEEDYIIRTNEAPLDEKMLGGTGFVCFNYMKKHSGNICQIDALTGKLDTFESLLKKCIRTSICLQKKGFSEGDVITYYSNIHLNAGVPLLASFFIGVIPSFLDTQLSSTDTMNLLKQVKPKLLLTDPEFSEKIKEIVENAHIDTEILIFDESFFNHQDEEESFKPIYINDLNKMSSIYFSSGSTGLSKGICLNHYAMLCSDLMEEENLWNGKGIMTLFSYDSFYWTVEMIRFTSSIRQGACRLISPKKFDESEVWHILEKYKVNVAYLIPHDMVKMCKHGKPENVSLDSLTTVISEGAPLPNKYQLALQELLPNADIFQIYGQTEAGVLSRFYKYGPRREYNRTKIGSVGQPVLGIGMTYRVVDLKSGKNVGPNKSGELRVKCNTVMLGYYNLDSSNEFDEDNWLKTGDVVYYDEDYYFYVVSRIKDVIIYKGWHITPASLEAVLVTHPAVKKSVVIGVPHEQDGERPLGVVVLDNEFSDLRAEEIERYFHAKAPDEPTLKIKVVKDIPLTATGKVQRQKLKKYILSHEV